MKKVRFSLIPLLFVIFLFTISCRSRKPGSVPCPRFSIDTFSPSEINFSNNSIDFFYSKNT